MVPHDNYRKQYKSPLPPFAKVGINTTDKDLQNIEK